MNTQLLDILKEKWTKKSTKIACVSVGTVVVLGVVGALIACNVPLYKQVVAEDGTVTTVQTPQKESHGILDLFHTPTESADAAQNTTTEITPPQTSADGTPINTPAGVTAPAQSTATNGNVGEAPAAPAQATDAASAPDPAPVQAASATPAAEQSAEPAEENPAPAPEPAAEPAPAPAEASSAPASPEQKNQWVKPVWVVDQAEVKAIPPKYNVIDYYLTSNGKVFSIDQKEALHNYQVTNHVGMTMRQKKEVIDPGRPYSPEKGHWEDPTTGKRLSPTYERSH